jgi:hypothetical protein
MAPTAPPHCPPITKADLRPGDVLLSFGDPTDWIDRLIIKLDDGIYSHAAVWDGTHVVEATLHGVVRTTLEDEQTQAYLDVYRWQSLPPDVHVLGDPPYPSQPVTDAADKIADSGTQYSYYKLMLAAFVVGVSKIPPDDETRAFVRTLVDKVAAWVLAHEKHGTTCTEVVATTFWDADASAARRYAIGILVDGSRDFEAIEDVAAGPSGPWANRLSEYERDKRKLLALFLRASSSMQRGAFKAWADAQAEALKRGPGLRKGGGPDVPLACVTPRDLERSPNLKCVGRLPHLPKAPPSDTALGDASRVLGRL